MESLDVLSAFQLDCTTQNPWPIGTRVLSFGNCQQELGSFAELIDELVHETLQPEILDSTRDCVLENLDEVILW